MQIGTTKNSDLIIDWDLGTKLAGNKPDLAKDLLRILIKNLPSEMRAIKKANATLNAKDLLQYVHKLHGAASYCGVPRLKRVLASFETAIKKNDINQLESFVDELEIEAKHVIQEASQSEIRG